jgi:3-oxoacyl-[acyl-carrier-protein] synthase-3
MPAFGGGLTWSAHLLKWGERTEELGTAEVALPKAERTGLEIVNGFRQAG